jgi:hypothetical protein
MGGGSDIEFTSQGELCCSGSLESRGGRLRRSDGRAFSSAGEMDERRGEERMKRADKRSGQTDWAEMMRGDADADTDT